MLKALDSSTADIKVAFFYSGAPFPLHQQLHKIQLFYTVKKESSRMSCSHQHVVFSQGYLDSDFFMISGN